MDSAAIAEVGCAVLAVACAVFGYLWNRSDKARDDMIDAHGDAIKELKQAQNDFELYAARTFVTSHTLETAISNFNRAVDAIFAKLDKISDKLDQKADKP